MTSVTWRIVEFVGAVEKKIGVRFPSVGVGSTPSCSHPSPLMAQLTELHPGNYIFYDVQQQQLGSCKEEDIAVAVATRITGHYPRRNQMLIDCGFTALTKQGWGKLATGYGVVRGHPHLKLCAMDQEHGFLQPLGPEKLDFSRYPVGTMLFILPYHSCATAAQFSQYLVVEDGVVVDEWRPTRGW
ncbi:D-serine dehydratase-like domain [Trinorchestia longiramus]|nr:D-serine dehydratase-like domain [Trinorchestia longiramus]